MISMYCMFFKKRLLFYLAGSVLLCVGVLFWCLVGWGVFLTADVSDCFAFSGEQEVACYTSLCAYEPGYLCAEDIVDAVTALRGPEAGIRVLQDISRSSLFVMQGDLHQLAHIVGRSAARNHGNTGDVFDRCPLDFDYGCLHGFFEYALSQVDSPASALISICDSFGKNTHDRGSCYHGGGHGLMMNESYDLDRALVVCRSLPAYQVDCYSGVFMENAIGFVAGRVPLEHNLFMPEENWTAPCDSLERRYRWYCYAYHHRNYLPYTYSAHSGDLVQLCLGAGEDVEVCLRGLAEAFVTVHNDLIFRTSFPNVTLYDRTVRAAYLCDHFPEKYISFCHQSVVFRLLRMDRTSSSHFHRAQIYCTSITKHAEVCDDIFEQEEVGVE